MVNNFLISASKDNTLRIWDTKRLECIYTLKLDFGRFIPLAVDEQYIYTYTSKKEIIIWSWKLREIVKKIKCNLGKYECAIAVDNNYIYCCPYIQNNKNWGIGIFTKQNWEMRFFIPINKLSVACSQIIIDGEILYVQSSLDLIEININNFDKINDWEPIHEDVYNFSLDSQYFYIGPYVISRYNHKHINSLLEEKK